MGVSGGDLYMMGGCVRLVCCVRLVTTGGGRCPLAQVDMQEIKQEFQRMYKKTLQSYIKDDTSGDYERILLAIVK